MVNRSSQAMEAIHIGLLNIVPPILSTILCFRHVQVMHITVGETSRVFMSRRSSCMFVPEEAN